MRHSRFAEWHIRSELGIIVPLQSTLLVEDRGSRRVTVALTGRGFPRRRQEVRRTPALMQLHGSRCETGLLAVGPT